MYRFDDLDPFAARRAKLKAWQDLGIDPYPAEVPQHEVVKVVRERTEGPAAVAGRIRALRGQGAITFMDVRDETGKIQVLFKEDALSAELIERLALLDLGDFIWVSGNLFTTNRGELTIEAQDWKIMSKSLRPLPDSWKGLQDDEVRQRQRYLELLTNDQVAERFRIRSRFVAAARRFMEDHGFTEVETPVLEHIPGGADAEPFKTHHNALDTDFYLRISLELALKRLAIGGFERVYEIGRVFRNEGISPQHLQEFTMFEFYWAYASYRELMQLVEEMYALLVREAVGSLQIERDGYTLDFTPPWPRVSYVELLKQYTGIDVITCSDQELAEAVAHHRGEEVDVALGRGRLMDMLYKKAVRPHLIQPQFLIDVPVEFSPLAKRRAGMPGVTERLMVLVEGAEVGNGFTELNDPLDQRGRLEEQERLRMKGDLEAQRMDEDFLRAMEYGMPPMTGFGVGIDRLLAIVLGVPSIRDTVFFPTMRPEKPEDKE